MTLVNNYKGKIEKLNILFLQFIKSNKRHTYKGREEREEISCTLCCAMLEFLTLRK